MNPNWMTSREPQPANDAMNLATLPRCARSGAADYCEAVRHGDVHPPLFEAARLVT